jgi:hypothetical protein
MTRLLLLSFLVALAGCFNDTVPSSFSPGDSDTDAAADGGRDGTAPSDAGNLLGDGGGPRTFPCGPTSCPAQTYCLITLTDAGAETSESCYPPVQCDAGDCTCIAAVVASAYCPGGHVTCEATAGIVTTCAP